MGTEWARLWEPAEGQGGEAGRRGPSSVLTQLASGAGQGYGRRGPAPGDLTGRASPYTLTKYVRARGKHL